MSSIAEQTRSSLMERRRTLRQSRAASMLPAVDEDEAASVVS